METTFTKGQQYIMNTYNRFPIAFARGEGVWLYDEDGKRYLDFVAGIAVNSLGHGHPALSSAIAKQALDLIHCSNLYWTKPQVSLAEKLVRNSGFEKVFFCNSGAEAIEAGLKLIRKYGNQNGKHKNEIITMQNSFHGRTYGAVTATGQAKYQKDLHPLLPGISHVPFNDFEVLSAAVTEQTGGILIEPIQGEGGIRPAEKEYLQNVRKLCDEKDILLIFDEVQCGVGRTGYLFAHEYYGVTPDAVAVAKGIAGGVPMGILLTNAKTCDTFAPGDHASTFGGNSLATAAANVVIDQLLGGILDNVKAQGDFLKQKLLSLQQKYPSIIDVRGVGLMQGIEFSLPVADIIQKCLDKGLLLVGSGSHVIRFVPPLIVTEEDIQNAAAILGDAINETII